ncbi:succinate-semialdehyde dehydrogenase (NADP(+)) [Chromatiales bacterium (ex Bugula neritina AB1)]|nr:succinate-semialdehyde dehydrogenase (NADP(+)) [Chromatiales bacterium (ex Bugula neritina AB1)]
MFINGKWLDSTATFPVYNPANGEEIARVADGGAAEARAAFKAAAEAFKSWSASTAHYRSAILYRAWQLMLERKDELAALMTQEQGKPLKAAANEVQYAADFLLWFAEEAKRNYGETIPSGRADQRFVVQHQPVGVVAAVTPWNYPVSMITRKVAPALAAGCTIVLKPAESTPLCAIEVFKILQEAGVPDGVVNLVTANDPAPVGEEFCSNPVVRKLTFTGSTAVGKKLARDAAGQLKRVSMELGGHAPFIVFEDADPVHAAKGAALVKFLNTGQACICPNRIFVHRNIATAFLETLTARVAKMRVGAGNEPGVAIGPLVNEQAIAKIDAQVTDACSKGAKVLAGGDRLVDGEFSNGYFYAPTILHGVTEEMLIYREETFGPVAPVVLFDDDDDILAMANDTTYGLAAYVYTQNLSLAMRTFEGLQFGIIGINDINPTSAAAPFGGMKNSGLGREGAREGMVEYLETKLGGFSV